MKTESKILGKSFDFSTKHLGLFLNDELWSHDKWIVTIEGQTFDYSTGIGHREWDRAKAWGNDGQAEFKRVLNMNPKKDRENLNHYHAKLQSISKVKPLEIDNILYSLVMDAYAGTLSHTDFCDNFGYDPDSIKGLSTYMECQKTLTKLRTFLPNIKEAQELFSEY